MITISEQAQSHFRKLLEKQAAGTHIRVFVVNPGTVSAECGVSYCPADAVESTDLQLPFEGRTPTLYSSSSLQFAESTNMS